MGIYDRDYYRGDESRSFLGGFTARTRVTTTLIIANVIFFLVQLITRDVVSLPDGRIPFPGWFTDTYAMQVDKVLQGEVWRLVTYAFLHSVDSLWHILFNMLFLYWFGSAIEDLYGSKEFLAFYLLAAFVGGVAYVLSALAGMTSMTGMMLGASGAVTAVLVVFAMHYPHHTVFLLFLPVPVWLLVVVQVGKDMLGLLGLSREPVAFATHLGGAAFGFLYQRMHWRVLNWLPSRSRSATVSARRVKTTNLRVYQVEAEPEVVDATNPTMPMRPVVNKEAEEHLEAQVDAVLAKVKEHGQESLTSAEREILFRAGEIYKRRRK